MKRTGPRRREETGMKSRRQITGFLTACILAVSMTAGAIADPVTYDATGASGQVLSGNGVQDRIYPGDRIANTEIYLGADNLYADIPETASDVLDDGTPCWVNNTGRVYSVTEYPVESGEYMDAGEPEQVFDEEGNPVFDEEGNPVFSEGSDAEPVMGSAYVLETIGGIVEVAYGSSGTDEQDPYTGGPGRDSSYSLRGDASYSYTDEDGAYQTVYASDIDAAAYVNGTSVYLNYTPASDPSQAFTGWSVYRVQPDGSMNRVSDDEIGQLGIPELYSAQELGADAVNAAGGRLSFTVSGMNDHLVFVPVFGAAPQEEAQESPDAQAAAEEGQENADQEDAGDAFDELADELNADAAGAESGILIPDAEDDVIQIGPEEADEIPAEMNADDASLAAAEAAPSYTCEIYVDYIDPEWNGPSTGYYTYTGGEFSEQIETAASNPEGYVFSGWKTDDDALIIEDADSEQTEIRMDSSAAMDGNKVIRVEASYTEAQPESEPQSEPQPEPQSEPQPEPQSEPQPEPQSEPQSEPQPEPQSEPHAVRSALNVTDGEIAEDLDPSQVEEGTEVTVTAARKDGLQFTGWTADGIDLDEDQKSAEQLTIRMPANEVSLTAQYQSAPADDGSDEQLEPADDGSDEQEQPADDGSDDQLEPADEGDEEPDEGQEDADVYTLSVVSGSAEKTSLSEGESTSLTADDPAAGYVFTSWTVDGSGSVDDASSAQTTFTMGAGDATVTANYSQVQHTLTVKNGSADKTSLAEGDTAVLKADTPPAGSVFSSWKVEGSGSVANASSAQTTFTMGAGDATVTANYKKVQYTLTVKSGSADKTSLAEGETAVLKAGTPKNGYEFSSWKVEGSGSVANASSAQTTFTMGAGNATVTANYKKVKVDYDLTVKNGSGSGTYENGETVSITANYPESGKEFDSWSVTKGSAVIADSEDYYATLTMGASNATVQASYHNGPNPNDNAITGLENGKEYLRGATLSFTAIGAGMDKSGRNPGDYRYRPVGYQIGSVTGSWSSAPYTTSMAINAVGDYTLTVTFAKDVFDGSSWSADGTTVSKSVTFHVVTTLSVETGDTSPLLPLMIAGGAALVLIIVLVVVMSRRKKRK